jgi:effector-binding domain-containing protein
MDEQHGLIDRLRRNWRILAIAVVIIGVVALFVIRRSVPTDIVDDTRPSTNASRTTGTLNPDPPISDDKTAASPGGQAENPAAGVMSQVVAVEARPAIVFKGEGKWEEADKLIPEALAKLKDVATKAGLPVNGRPVTVFTKTDDSGFSFEAMLPLVAAPEGKSKLAVGVEVGSSPSGKALKFQHRGSYDEIEATYEAIAAYLDEKGLDTKDLIVEEYLGDFKADDAMVDVDIYVFIK